MLLLNLRGADGPLYRRVYHALKSTIRAGRLAPDARLPSTRELAADLRVSRNTVMLAYEQLLAEGYVVTRDRATTSVASALPAPAKPVSFRPQPAPPAAVSAYARRLMRGPGPGWGGWGSRRAAGRRAPGSRTSPPAISFRPA